MSTPYYTFSLDLQQSRAGLVVETVIVLTLFGVVRWQKSAKAKLETSLSKQVTFGTFCLNNTGKIFVQKQLTNIRIAFRKACSNKHRDRTLNKYNSVNKPRPRLFSILRMKLRTFFLKENSVVSFPRAPLQIFVRFSENELQRKNSHSQVFLNSGITEILIWAYSNRLRNDLGIDEATRILG